VTARLVPDYGPAYGVVTPMANTTVEPEMQILLPGTVMAARAVSASPDSRTRLLDYVAAIPAAVESFDVAPVAAIGFACTCYYLLGAEREAADTAAMTARAGVPVTTSTLAVRAMLTRLGARRIALLAPYPAWLAAEAVGYYAALGIEVVARGGLPSDLVDTRGIYRLTSARVHALFEAFDPGPADVVVLGGTGMPTLDLIAAARGRPVLSSNLAMAAVMAGAGSASPERVLDAYLAPDALWRARLARFRTDVSAAPVRAAS